MDGDQRQSARPRRSTSSCRIARTANLLIVGNDIGVFVSIDGGASWTRLKANLPTVAVHDLTIHPRENDLVLGTYGRAIWVGDITPLQELSPETLDKTAHLFDIEPRARYGFGAIGNYHLFGDSYLEVPNEPEALVDQLLPERRTRTGRRASRSPTRRAARCGSSTARRGGA